MSLVCRIGDCECYDCGAYFAGHKWHVDKPFSLFCACGGRLHFVKRKKNHHFGQLSDDINSDLYYKNAQVRGTQTVSEGRRLRYTYHKIEKMEERCETPKIDDFDMIKGVIAEYDAKEAAGISLGEPAPRGDDSKLLDWRKKAKDHGITIKEELKPV